jgi:hypothetical protein
MISANERQNAVRAFVIIAQYVENLYLVGQQLKMLRDKFTVRINKSEHQAAEIFETTRKSLNYSFHTLQDYTVQVNKTLSHCVFCDCVYHTREFTLHCILSC